jgi:hypothetical protein
MTSNMAIGPVTLVGGNEVQATQRGDIQVTNPNGKKITLSRDEFFKQTRNNVDKISNGETVEYKKDRKGLKIFAAATATAAVVIAGVKHKAISKYMKDFSFKKLWNDFRNLFRISKKGQKADTPHLAEARRLANQRKDAQIAFETYDVNKVEKAIDTAKEEGKPLNKKGLGLTNRRYLKDDGTVMNADEQLYANEASKKAAKYRKDAKKAVIPPTEFELKVQAEREARRLSGNVLNAKNVIKSTVLGA